MAKENTSGGGHKAVALVAALIGAALARKSLRLVWRAATGKEPPAKPELSSVTWAEALAWAALSGAAIGVGRMVAQKAVAPKRVPAAR